MKKLLELIIGNIISEAFSVEESSEENRVIFTIKVPENVVGIIIGKGGTTIKAIQDILRIKASLEKKYVILKVEATKQ